MAKPVPWLAPAIWAGALMPVPMLVIQARNGDLGANPVSEALNRLGLLALISLMACLACTPAQKIFSITWPVRIRKHLGNVAFTYASLHLLTWSAIDHGLDWGVLVSDILERPFITIGVLAWLSLLPLALTSTNAAVKRLGFARWKRLHRLIYVIGGLVCIHFLWRVKIITAEPVIYACVFGALMGWRLVTYMAQPKRKARA